MADNTETPGAGSLEITPTDAEFTNTGDMRLIITGKAPAVSVDVAFTVSPGSGSLGLTENSPLRAYGLQLIGAAPLAAENMTLQAVVGSLSIVGRRPVGIGEDPPNEVVSPDEGILAITGRMPSAGGVIGPGVVTSSFTGAAPTVQISHVVGLTGDADPEDFTGTIEITGIAPTASLSSEFAVTGNLVTNTQATDYDGRYNICDRTGFKAKPGQLIEDGYGNMVLPEFRDSRHPQEFVRSRGETHPGPKRPEPVGNELDVDDEYPSGVSVDDL